MPSSALQMFPKLQHFHLVRFWHPQWIDYVIFLAIELAEHEESLRKKNEITIPTLSELRKQTPRNDDKNKHEEVKDKETKRNVLKAESENIEVKKANHEEEDEVLPLQLSSDEEEQ